MLKKEISNDLGIQYYQIYDGGKIGIADKEGHVIVAPKYELVHYVEKYQQFIVKLDGLFGLIDMDGNTLAAPKYVHISYTLFPHCHAAETFQNENGYHIQSVDGFGWLSTKGIEVIPPIYQEIEKLTEMYFIGHNTTKYSEQYRDGIYTNNGEEAKLPQDNRYTDIGEGFISVNEILEKDIYTTAVFNDLGEAIAPNFFEKTRSFSEGMLCVQLHESVVDLYENAKKRKLSKKKDYSYLDALVFTNIPDDDDDDDDDDWEDDDDFQAVYYCFIDKTGKLINKRTYSEVRDFKNGFAAVCIGDRWGAIDQHGNEVVPLIYDMIVDFKNGHAKVINADKQGIVDAKENVVIPIEHDFLGNVTKDQLVLCIDNDVLSCLDFDNNKYTIQLDKDGKKVGFYDMLGKRAPAQRMSDLKPVADYDGEIFYDFEYRNKEGLMDANWNVIIPPQYDAIHFCWGGIGYAQKDGKFAFYNSKGEFITPFEYDNASLISKGVCSGTKGNKRALITDKGAVTEAIFDFIGRKTDHFDQDKKEWVYSDRIDWGWYIQNEAFILHCDEFGGKKNVLSSDLNHYSLFEYSKDGKAYLKTDRGFVDLDGVEKTESKKHKSEDSEMLLSLNYPKLDITRTAPAVIADSKIIGLKNKISKIPNVSTPAASMQDYLAIHNQPLIDRMRKYEIKFLMALSAACIEWMAWRFVEVGKAYSNYDYMFQRIDALYAGIVDPQYVKEYFPNIYFATDCQKKHVGLDDKETSHLEFLDAIFDHWYDLFQSYVKQYEHPIAHHAAGTIVLCRAAIPKTKIAGFETWLDDVLTRAKDYYQKDTAKQTYCREFEYNLGLDKEVSRSFFFDQDVVLDVVKVDSEVKTFLDSLDWDSNPYLDAKDYQKHPFKEFS